MGDAINFGPAWLRKGPNSVGSSLGGGPPPHSNNNSISSGGGGGGHHHTNSIHTNSSGIGGSSSSSNNNNNSSSSGSAGGGGGSGVALAAINAAAVVAVAAAAASSTATRYALAEFRYGREEMLALFDVKSVKSPEILVNFKNLFVEKVQCPLALIPCTDDDAVPEPDSRRVWQSRSISLGVPGRGARGGSVDRGRGRGRGFLTGYQRSTSFYDDEARGVGRGERPWLERNGTGGGGPLGGGGGGGVGGGSSGPGGPGEVDWNSSSSSSPRKEFGVRARTANMDSWRRSRPDDEPNTTDWRSGGGGGGSGGLSTSLSGSSLRDKWSRSTSWREEDSSGGIGDGPGGRPLNSLHSSSSAGGYKPRMSVLSGGDLNTSGGPGGALRRHWDADELPEWATENPSDYGGSFDASGAFHDSDNDIDGRLEDDGGKENHVDHRHHHQQQRKEGSSSGGSSRRSVPSSKEGSAAKDDLPNHVASSSVVKDREEDPGSISSKKKAEPLRESAAAHEKQKSSEPESNAKPPSRGLTPSREAMERPKTAHQAIEMAAENDISKTAASSKSTSRDGSVTKPSEGPSEVPEQHHVHQQQHLHQLQQQHQQIRHEPKKSASSSSVDRMQEVADDMVAQLIMDDEYTGSGVDSEPVPVVDPSRSLDKSPVLGGQIPINLLLSSKDPVAMQQLFGGAGGGANSRMLHGLGGGPQIPPPIAHPGTDIWYYRDPQGKVQGPFPASEMTEWYRAGYFDDSLSVRRACDDIYTNLGSLVALCGGAIPFLNSMNIPPIKASSKQPPQPQPPQGPPASSFQQQQQKQHLQQQQQQPPLDSDLSAQFQFSKKLALLRQQSLIMQKLSSADGWQLLSQEQQNAIIAQHMAQLQLTDGGVMISPTPQNPVAAAAAANASNPPNPASIFGGGQPPQDSLVNLKQVQQQQQQGPGQPHPVLEQLQKSNSLSNAFPKMPDFGQPQPGGRPMLGNLNVDPTAAGHDHLGQLIHNINFNHQPPVQNLPGLGSNMLLKHNLIQQQQQQQQQSQPPKPNLENDPIQSLLMQLSMHKQQQQQQQQPPQPTKTPVEMMSPWMQNATMPPQQQQQQQSRPLSSGWGDLPPVSGQSAASAFGALGQPSQHLGGHPLVNEPQAPSVVSLFKHHQQADKQQNQQEKLVNDSQQMHQQHHHHHQQQQQQANHQQPFERTQQKLDSIAAQQQQQNHQPFERTQQKLDSIAAQQQAQQQQQLQHQQQQQQFVQQQQKQQQPPPAKDDRKEQQELLLQQQQQQQQHLHQQQQFQQAINKQVEKPAPVAKQTPNKVVNNVEAVEKQMLQEQQSGKPQKGGNKKQQQPKQQPLPDDDQGEFINMKKEMEEKKRQKELKKQQQEEAKRKQLEEKKKLDELEAQKKAKLLEVQRREAQKIQEQQQQQQQQPQQPPRPVTKVAPWSASVAAETAVTGPSLAEIQKAERERRVALARQEQSLREQQQQQELVELQSQLDSKLKWNSQTLPPQNIKSLAEIQAEEAAAADRNREKNAAAITAAAIAASSSKPSKKDDLLGTAVWQSQSGGSSALTWNASKLWGNSDEQNSNNVSSGGFWEEPNPSNKNGGRQKHHHQQQQQQQHQQHQQQQQQAQNQKQLLAKSKTMGSISTASSSNAVAAAKQHQQKQQQQQQHQQQQQQLAAKQAAAAAGRAKNAAGNGKERAVSAAAHNAGPDQTTHEFTGWCTRALTSLGSNVDIPTFVGFLQDIESPFEVKDYIRLYLGETKDCAEFAKQFLERRSKYKNQMRQRNAHIDDMCKPAPAINPSSNDFQEIKKVKKNKMTKLDNRILGFSVTAAPDRLNVGDRDYGDNA